MDTGTMPLISGASSSAVHSMSDKDEQPESDFEDLEQASRVNFRDYPSSALVIFAALSSGLGWMAYKWMGRKRKARNSTSEESGKAENSTGETKPTVKGSD
jgi:hypothetical protein